MGTIFRLQVYEKVGISLVAVGRKTQKGLTDALDGCEKS